MKAGISYKYDTRRKRSFNESWLNNNHYLPHVVCSLCDSLLDLYTVRCNSKSTGVRDALLCVPQNLILAYPDFVKFKVVSCKAILRHLFAKMNLDDQWPKNVLGIRRIKRAIQSSLLHRYSSALQNSICQLPLRMENV
jgi:hypothetical protein